MTWIKLDRHECDPEPPLWLQEIDDAGTIIKCSVCGKMKELHIVHRYDEWTVVMEWIDV